MFEVFHMLGLVLFPQIMISRVLRLYVGPEEITDPTEIAKVYRKALVHDYVNYLLIEFNQPIESKIMPTGCG